MKNVLIVLNSYNLNILLGMAMELERKTLLSSMGSVTSISYNCLIYEVRKCFTYLNYSVLVSICNYQEASEASSCDNKHGQQPAAKIECRKRKWQLPQHTIPDKCESQNLYYPNTSISLSIL